ncbi:transposase [Rhodopirellula europaea 6C]|uniref:Transposase n=1 Tax=Rhodopirellula europaea 6C TaxID=1263867 RepID=M2AXD0_9BACT|nr:transposase [Rhodopirellula europaea 6C]
MNCQRCTRALIAERRNGAQSGQRVKASERSESRRDVGGKNTKDRKRNIAVGTFGLLLAALVTIDSVDDA